MKIQARKLPLLQLSTRAAVAIFAAAIAIASLAISAQGFDRDVTDAAPPDLATAPESIAPGAPHARAYRCDECGVIESVRKIEIADDQRGAQPPGRTVQGKRSAVQIEPLRNYEITIRLHDGSMRVITDARPAKWRYREEVTIIAGVD